MYILSMAAELVSPTPQAVTQQSSDMFLGVGNLLVTLIVGLITCIVTWKVAVRDTKKAKLTYNMSIYPILLQSITNKTAFSELEILYKKERLENPCLLTVDITNSGLSAIKNPPIRILTNEDIRIIPGYLEDVPDGYEKVWDFNPDTASSCKLAIEHINSKQTLKARFYLDRTPKEKLVFECPMADIQIQENIYDRPLQTSNEWKFLRNKTNTIFALIILMILYAWIKLRYWLDSFFEINNIHLYTYQLCPFIILVCLLTIIMNIYGLGKIDRYIRIKQKLAQVLKIGIPILAGIILFFMIIDYIIVGNRVQIVVAIIVGIMLAIWLHILTIRK